MFSVFTYRQAQLTSEVRGMWDSTHQTLQPREERGPARPLGWRHIVGVSMIACGLLFVSGVQVARADVIKLVTGGEIRGKLAKPISIPPAASPGAISKPPASKPTAPQTNSSGEQSPPLPDEPVTILLATGGEITILRSQIAFITPRSPLLEEYETRADSLADTVEAHWELANWARQKGLVKQREEQLREVLRLDPEDEKAHLALNHTFQEGKWVDRDEWMMARGYVKYKGRYITLQELELLERSKAELEAEQAWFPKIRLWLNWLASENSQRNTEGLMQFEQLSDPAATAAIERFAMKDPRRDFRLVAVASLSRLQGERPAAALARIALFDEDLEIRFNAVSGLRDDQLANARGYWVRHLRHDLNPIVCRAGRALFMRGDDSSVDALIDALVTRHRYQVQVPLTEGVSATGLRSGGGTGTAPVPGGGNRYILPNGQVVEGAGRVLQDPTTPRAMKTVTVEQVHQNEEVREAVMKLTGQNFGFDQRTWRLWRSAQKAGALPPG
ncbi:MAG: hypothetical protein C0478_08520 [Planctomyces sp.]|nr:hypothetical protein [Planctomyces sp.]